ncbi:hypothetical protein TWF718_010836 [Orbilia javanica]|uniref:Glucose-methanol-choline oxidoreductase C-terminal domain-containing protein n=1 Tax=Orbilia javanica TaxID=47235 RepID=A0AAN8MQY9_9PEZI
MNDFFATDPDLVSQNSSQGFYDYIVVGSGIGGGILASELAKRNKNVLLIEKGGLDFHTHVLNTTRPHSAYGSGASQDNNIVFAAMKQPIQTTPNSEPYVGGPVYSLGGRSTLWSLWIPAVDRDTLNDYFPGVINDYLHGGGYEAAFSLLTNNSQTQAIYPRGHIDQHVLAEAIAQLDQAIEAWRPPGHHTDLGPVATELISPSPYIFPMGAYSSVDSLIQRTYNRDRHLTILLGTEVLWANREERIPDAIASLIVRTIADQRIREINTRGAQVILCAGSIGTASIALSSGLQLSNPLVGKGLMDHQIWGVRFAQEIPSGRERSPPIKLSCLVNICNRRALLNVIINIDEFFARGLHVCQQPQVFDQHCSLIKDPPRLLFGADMDELYVELEYLDELDDSNEVINNPSRYPTISIRRPTDLLTEENQLQMQMIATQIRNTVLTREIQQPDVLAPRLSRGGFGVVAHEAGTMRMPGPQPGASSVVDADLKVIGLQNLHVCDLSVFPVSPPANPSLTLAALSLRLAEHLVT